MGVLPLLDGPSSVEALEARIDGLELAKDLGSGDVEHGGLISDRLELLEEPYAITCPSESPRCRVQAKGVLSLSPLVPGGEEGVDDQAVAWGSAFSSPMDDRGLSPPSLSVFGRVLLTGDFSGFGGLSKSKGRENESIWESVSVVAELDFSEGFYVDSENL